MGKFVTNLRRYELLFVAMFAFKYYYVLVYQENMLLKFLLFKKYYPSFYID